MERLGGTDSSMISESLLSFAEDVVSQDACRNAWAQRYIAYVSASRTNGMILRVSERVARFFLGSGPYRVREEASAHASRHSYMNRA